MKNLLYLAAITLIAGTITSCNNQSKTIGLTNSAKTAIYDQGVNIAYTDTGKSDTTLVFVHGWAINRSYWTDQAAYFAKRYRIVAIDLPGFGESGKNRDKWGTKEFSRDVDSVIKGLDLKKVVLVGHSMSGDIVLQAAIDNPDRVVCLIGVDNFENVGYAKTAQDKKDFDAAVEQLKHNFKATAWGYFNQALFSKTTSPEIKKRILNDVAHVDTTIAVTAMEEGNDFNEVDKLRQVKRKLYLINSDVNPIYTKYLAAKKIPFQVYYMNGIGHFPMVEAPKEFNEYLDKIIEDINRKP